MKREHQIGVAVTCTFLCLTGAVIGLKMRNQPAPAKAEKAVAEKEVAPATPQTRTKDIEVPSLLGEPPIITIDAEVKEKPEVQASPSQKSVPPPVAGNKKNDSMEDKTKKQNNTAEASKVKSTEPPVKAAAEKHDEKQPIKVAKEDKSHDKSTIDKKDEGKDKNKKEDGKDTNSSEDNNKKSNIVGFPVLSGGSNESESGKPPLAGSEKNPPKTASPASNGVGAPKPSVTVSSPDAEKGKAKPDAPKPPSNSPQPLYLSPLVSDDPPESPPPPASIPSPKSPSTPDSSAKATASANPPVPAKPVSKGTSEAPFLLGSSGGAAPTSVTPLTSAPPPAPSKPDAPPAPYKPLGNPPPPPAPAAGKPTPDGSYFVPDPPSAASSASQTTPGLLPYPTPPSDPAPAASARVNPAAPSSLPPPTRLVPRVLEYTEQEYICQTGDTFETLSKRYYLSEAYAGALRRHNQNHPRADDRMVRSGALVPGERIFIPPADILEQRYGDAIVKPPTNSPTLPASYTEPTPRR